MSWLRFVLRCDDLLSCRPWLHGHYPLQRYYDGSDFCLPSHDVPAQTDLLCSRHVPCLTYDHQTPWFAPPRVPCLPSRTAACGQQGFATREQARRCLTLAESCSLSLSSVRFFSVALHPASRRRSYFKFSSGTRFPMAEVFHLGGSWRFTAHSRAPVGAHVQRDCASCLYPVVLTRSSLHHRLISTEPPAHRSVGLGARLVNLNGSGG